MSYRLARDLSLLFMAVLLFLIGALFSLFESNVPLLGFSGVMAILLSLLPVFFLFFINIKYKGGETFFYIISFYFVFAYFIKSVLIVNWPYKVKSFANVDVEEVLTSIPYAYIYVFIFFVAFCMAAVLGKKWFYFLDGGGGQRKEEPLGFELGYLKCVFSIVILLIIKCIIHYVLFLGVPGVEPQFVLPGVTGVLAFLSRLGAFFVVNYYLVYSYIFDPSPKNKIASMAFVVFYIAIDLSIGVKFSIIYEIVIFSFIASQLLKDGKIKLTQVFWGAVFSIFVLMSFKYINYYRFGLLHGMSGFDALNFALNSSAAQEKSFFIELINRVTGVENFLVAYHIEKDIAGSFFEIIWSGSLGDEITESITGVKNSINAVGVTQIGAIYIGTKGNVALFFSASFFCALTLLAALGFLFKKSFGSKLVTSDVNFSEVFMAIFFIYFLFGSGGLWFFIKEAAVSCGAVWAFVHYSRGIKWQ